MKRVGVLHPGDMGSSIGACLVGAGTSVAWASEDRSTATAERAARDGLRDVGSVSRLAHESDLLLSVCPPAAAIDVARAVAASDFRGVYADLNAVSRSTAETIAEVFTPSEVVFVDGCVIGPPARSSGTTRLFLAGGAARDIAGLFLATPVEAVVLDGQVGTASSLKMCYAAWTKGTSALLLAVRALATAEGVEEPLLREWSRSQPSLDDRSSRAATNASAKGARWVGEMLEIADAMRSVGLPAGFHESAASVFERARHDAGSHHP